MGFFRRNKAAALDDFVGKDAPSAPDLERSWAELEAATRAKASPPEPVAPATTQGAGSLEGASTVADDLQRYQDMDLSTELGDTPSIDATPGRLDVDIDALLASPEMKLPDPVASEAPAPVQDVDREPALAPALAPAAAEAAEETAQSDDFRFDIPVLPSRDNRADLGTMRLDVARIAADIQSGEELYRRAQKRIENLTGFVERAELDFSLLGRLEPENRRLKARNRTLESEIDDAKRKVDVMRADLEDHQKRLAERGAILERLHAKMSLAQKSLQEYERVLGATRTNSDKHALAAERAQTSLDVERRENEVLRTRVTELTAELDQRSTQTIEAQKMTDSLRQDAGDFRAQTETLSTENIELRNALDHAMRANNVMRGEMVSLHEDIRTFKTQSEFTVIAREDEMGALKAQLHELTKQLEIKDEIVRNAARDVQELRKVRTAQDLERERLESIIETQTFQLEEAGARLIEAQQNVTDFDRRYRDVAAALNQQQAVRESSPPAAQPDIAPYRGAVHATVPTAAPLADPLETLGDEDIEARITDFALGLRDDIAS